MELLKRFLQLWAQIFTKRKQLTDTNTTAQSDSELNSSTNTNTHLEAFEKLKFENAIYTKLDWLEEYIKSFAKTHPEDYNSFLSAIKIQRKSYDLELQSYMQGLEGNLTFSIDPERESLRKAQVSTLEKDIFAFVNHVVLYDKYKELFSVLCSKTNTLYNAIINWRISHEKLKEHFTAANLSCEKLISEVKELDFFKSDSRKKEKILERIIYFDYLLFKSALRYEFCTSLDDYKTNISKLHNLFVDSEYNDLIIKFFIQDLECIKDFCKNNLLNFESHLHILKICEQLQITAQNLSATFIDVEHFTSLIKLENTSEEAGKLFGVDFVLDIPKVFLTPRSKSTSVNITAISVLKLVNKPEAKLLLELIKGFKIDISWKEFYFLCKIFELCDDIAQISKSTIFTHVESKFREFDQKYPQYSEIYIAEQKRMLLSYNGSKKKKYILLFDMNQVDFRFASRQLNKLGLDFHLRQDGIYLNHAYFNGFKNLEQIFGNYIII